MDPFANGNSPVPPGTRQAEAGANTAPLFPHDLPPEPGTEMTALRRLPGPVLSGSTSYFPPSAVLSLLNLQKATGVLYLQNRALAATIGLEDGEVVAATLGNDQGLPALFYALSWNTGTFEFRRVPPGPRSINLTLPVIQVRATLWLDRWKELRRFFPTIWHRVGIHPPPAGDVVIQPHQWQVLTRIVAEPISLVRLAELLRMDVLAVTRVAVELVMLGLAIVVAPDEGEAERDAAAEEWNLGL